jgi:hypothetical protein
MAFNINAQVILSGPKNLSAITSTIKKQLSTINVNVNLKIPKQALQQLQAINSTLAATTANSKKLNSASQSAATSVGNIGKQASLASNSMQRLGVETAKTFKRFAAAGIVTATFFKLTRAISSAVPKALELQTQMTRLQQVTGKSRKQLDGLAKSVDKLSVSLGIDANELTNIARIFAQTGQSLRQVEASMRAVAKASLAPTFGTMEQTAEGLIASLNQFNIKAAQSEEVLGSLNNVSKKFAVESGDLVTAIRKTGAVFALGAGQIEKPIDALHEFNAIFTSVRATTRESADTIAAGLKTIFSRIQRRSSIEALDELGIKLVDMKGKFIGLYPALQEIGKRLESVFASGDSLALSAITEELGGIRQVGKLIPAIKEYKKAQQALEASKAGALQGLDPDVSLGLLTMAKSLDQVKASFQSLVNTISESKTFEVMIKGVTLLANTLLKMADNLTAILPALAAFAAIKLAGAASSFGKGFLGSFGAGGGVKSAGSALGSAATGGGAKAQISSSKALAVATKGLDVTNKLLLAATKEQTGATGVLTTKMNEVQVGVKLLTAAINKLSVQVSRAPIGFPRGGGRGRPRGFAHGGIVPGTGNGDTVEAMLTPGEFVLTTDAVEAIGAGNLENMQRQGFAKGGSVGNIGSDFGLSVFKKTDVTNGSQQAKKGVLVSALNKDKKIRTIMNEALRFQISGTAKDTMVNVSDLPDSEFIPPSLAESVAKEGGLPNKSVARSLKGSDLKNNPKFKGKQLLKRAAKFPSGARLTASNMSFGSLSKESGDVFDDKITGGIPKLFGEALDGFTGELKLGDEKVPLEDLLSNSGIGSLKGQLFEAFVRRVGGQVVKDEDKKKDDIFDFRTGDSSGSLETYKQLFGKGFKLPNEVKVSSSTDSVTSAVGKAVKEFGAENIKLNPKKFAAGGVVDSVPSLLTPGEFVFNPEAVKSIGLNNLEEMNKQKPQKFAKGGRVKGASIQKFGAGGAVAGAGLALTTLGLVPESLNEIVGTASLVAFSLGGLGIEAKQVVNVFKSIQGKSLKELATVAKQAANAQLLNVPVLGDLTKLQKGQAEAIKKASSAQIAHTKTVTAFQKKVGSLEGLTNNVTAKEFNLANLEAAAERNSTALKKMTSRVDKTVATLNNSKASLTTMNESATSTGNTLRKASKASGEALTESVKAQSAHTQSLFEQSEAVKKVAADTKSVGSLKNAAQRSQISPIQGGTKGTSTGKAAQKALEEGNRKLAVSQSKLATANTKVIGTADGVARASLNSATASAAQSAAQEAYTNAVKAQAAQVAKVAQLETNVLAGKASIKTLSARSDLAPKVIKEAEAALKTHTSALETAKRQLVGLEKGVENTGKTLLKTKGVLPQFSKSVKAGTRLLKGMKGGLASIVASLAADPIGGFVKNLLDSTSGFEKKDLGEGITGFTDAGGGAASLGDVEFNAAIGGMTSGAIQGAAALYFLGPFGIALGAAVGGLLGFMAASQDARLAQREFSSTLKAQEGISILDKGLLDLADATSLTTDQMKRLAAQSKTQDKGVQEAIGSSVSKKVTVFGREDVQTKELSQDFAKNDALSTRISEGFDEGFFNGIGKGLSTLAGRFTSALDEDPSRNRATAKLENDAIVQQSKNIGESVEKQRNVLGRDLGANNAAKASDKVVASAVASQNNASLQGLGKAKSFDKDANGVVKYVGALNRLASEMDAGEGNALKEAAALARGSATRLKIADAAANGGTRAKKIQRSFEIMADEVGGAGELANLSAEEFEELQKKLGLTSESEKAYSDAVRQKLHDAKLAQNAEIRAAEAMQIVANNAAAAQNRLDALAAAMVELGAGAGFATAQLAAQRQGIEADVSEGLSGKSTVRAVKEINPFTNLQGATPESIEQGFNRVKDVTGGTALSSGLETTTDLQKKLPGIFRDIIGSAETDGGFENVESLIDKVKESFPDFDKLPKEIQDSLTTSIKDSASSSGGDLKSTSGLEKALKGGEVDKALGVAAQKSADGLAKMIDALDAVNDANYKAADIRRQISEREQQGALKGIEIAKRASDALDSVAQKPQFATDNLKKARKTFDEKATATLGGGLTYGGTADVVDNLFSGIDPSYNRKYANDQANGRINEFTRDNAEQGAQDNAVVLQRDAAGNATNIGQVRTPGITNAGDPEQRRAQAKAASENITKLTSVFDAIKADPATNVTTADQKALLREIQNQTAILDATDAADIQGTGMAAGVDIYANTLQESITAENAMLDVLKLMRDDTTLIAAAQEDLKSLQRLQLSGEQLAKSDLQELGKIQRETDPGKKAALIQERQDRKGNTALRKIQSGEELDLTDMANLLNNLDELGSTDFALQNPEKFQEFVNQAKRQGGQAAEAGRGQLGEPERKIQTDLAGKDLTKTPEAEALRAIEAEQQVANDALVKDSVAKVEEAAVAMLAAAEQAYKEVEASVARANALRGTDANVNATEAPIAPKVPHDSRFREGGAEQQALEAVPVASNAGPGADFGGFANVEDRVSLRSKPKPASGPSSGVPRTDNPQIDSILDSMDASVAAGQSPGSGGNMGISTVQEGKDALKDALNDFTVDSSSFSMFTPEVIERMLTESNSNLDLTPERIRSMTTQAAIPDTRQPPRPSEDPMFLMGDMTNNRHASDRRSARADAAWEANGGTDLPNRVATGNVRPNVDRNGNRPFQSTLQFDENAKPTGGMKVPEDIEIAATIGDFQINLMGTENAIGQLQNAVVSVALEQIQQQLPALIEEQQAKIKGQV